MSTSVPERKKITALSFRQKKARGQPISMVTAYDYPTAMIADEAAIDSILIGDSLGMVVLGYETTLPVTMEDILHHSKAVVRGASHALIIADLPFMSYQVSVEQAVMNAGRLIKEGGVDAVKLEGGRERAAAVRAIEAAGIPVMGHLGLTPQSVRKLGGFRTQGLTAQAALRLLEDALALEEAGCFSIVLESIPARLAALITQRLQIPTIGIGAGAACDGQVLVQHDMLGLFHHFRPKFAKAYADLYTQTLDAFKAYRAEVEQRAFPDADHSYEMPDEAWQALQSLLPE